MYKALNLLRCGSTRLSRDGMVKKRGGFGTSYVYVYKRCPPTKSTLKKIQVNLCREWSTGRIQVENERI